MADGLGLLGSPRLEGLREANADILSGPSPAEVSGSRSTASSGLNLDATTAPAEREPGGFGASSGAGPVKRILEEIAAVAFGGTTRGQIKRKFAEASALAQVRKAQARSINLETMARGLQLIQPIAQGIASEPDETKRALMLEQHRPEIAGMFGQTGVTTLEQMVSKELVAIQRMEELIPQIIEHSPKGSAALAAANGDFSELTPEAQVGIFEDINRGQAIKSTQQSRALFTEAKRIFKARHHAEFAKMSESEGGFGSVEAMRIVEETLADNPKAKVPGAMAAFRALHSIAPENMDIIPGKDVLRTRQKVRESEAQQRAEAKFRAPSAESTRNALLVIRPDGTKQMSFDGGRTDPTTGKSFPPGSFPASVQGTPADVAGVASKEFVKLREQEIAGTTAIQLMRDVQDLITSRPEVLGLPGTFANLGEQFAASARGMANIFDKFVIDGKDVGSADAFEEGAASKFSMEIDKATDSLQRPGIDRARVKSAVVGMAFAAAAASGQTGRGVSDRDYKAFLERVGESASPEAFTAVLRDLEVEIARNLETAFEVTTRGVDSDKRPQKPDLFSKFGIARPVASDESKRETKKKRLIIIEETP